MADGLSRYIAEISQFGVSTGASAVYCFVVGGNRGDGGCPILLGMPTDNEDYVKRMRVLLEFMKRSVVMMEADIERMKSR